MKKLNNIEFYTFDKCFACCKIFATAATTTTTTAVR